MAVTLPTPLPAPVTSAILLEGIAFKAATPRWLDIG
jgi:hypothetical protein